MLLLLGVERGEARSVALMTAHSFFIGGTTVFFETAASATFLSRFDARLLPWVYVAAAGASLFASFAYSQLQHRLSFAALMRGTLGVLVVLALGLRGGFAVSGAPWLAFAGLVAYRLVSSLTDLEYWAVAARIYDVGQAKRLFGLVGTGEVTARLLGALAVPFVVRVLGVANLLLLSAVSLGACLILLEAVLATAGRIAPDRAPHEWRGGVRGLLADRYVGLVVAVAVLATFGKFFVDFTFLRQIAGRTETELAVFLGWFGAGTQVVSLLLRVLVSRPLLERLGVRVGVLTLPALHALCTLLILLVSPATAWVFVIGNQALYKSLKHPIDNASFKVLYQPLRPRERLGAQLLVEVFFVPLIAGVSGVIMLVLGRHYDVATFAWVLLATFVLWLVAAHRAGKAFPGS